MSGDVLFEIKCEKEEIIKKLNEFLYIFKDYSNTYLRLIYDDIIINENIYYLNKNVNFYLNNFTITAVKINKSNLLYNTDGCIYIYDKSMEEKNKHLMDLYTSNLKLLECHIDDVQVFSEIINNNEVELNFILLLPYYLESLSKEYIDEFKKELFKNKKIQEKMINNLIDYYELFDFINPDLYDETFILRYISINPIHMYKIDKKYYTYEILLCAVKKNGLMIELATGDLKNNNILIKTALKQNYLVYNKLDDDLKNKEFINKCIKINVKVLLILSKKDIDYFEILKDDEIQQSLINNYKTDLILFSYINTDLYNEELILEYTSIDPRHLYNINKKYYTYYILFNAIKKDGYMIKFATDKFKDNENLIEAALKQTHYAYNYLDENIKNKEFIKKCIKINPKISKILSKKDKELLTVSN